MANEPVPAASLFTQVDISAGATPSVSRDMGACLEDQTQTLRQILAALARQNELLTELVAHSTAPQRQRQSELEQWKKANPGLARECRGAAETLSKVQSEFLSTLTDEISLHGESLGEGEFLLSEFVDRFGPRLAHLNGILQVLAQLSSAPATAPTQGS
jgi:hypothetical protein